jgi:hypothetical protein
MRTAVIDRAHRQRFAETKRRAREERPVFSPRSRLLVGRREVTIDGVAIGEGALGVAVPIDQFRIENVFI